MANGESVEQVLGTICLLADTIPSHDSPKIDFGEFLAVDAERPRRAVRSPERSIDAAPEGEGAADEAGRIAAPRGEPVKPGSEESFYLLATYCFDLQRKMEYLYRATHAYGKKGDPGVARELLDDERRINAPGLTWKERAIRAEKRMLELQREIGREHLALLRDVAKRDR